jgi:glycosyltransferase involved in cell wall biosynthesis
MFRELTRFLREADPHALIGFQHYGNLVGATAARLAGVPLVIVNRTTAGSLVPAWAKYLDLAFGCAGLFDAIVVNSKEIEDEYGRYPKLYRGRVRRIDHGFEPKTTDLDQASARAAFALPPDQVLLGCVARLHPGKNLGAAISLLSHNNDWNIAFAGQGPGKQSLRTHAEAIGVSDRVHFVGELSPLKIGVFLKALDVFVFPSLAESFGLAPVEAAQAGVPVVAHHLDVLREVLALDGHPCALFVDANRTDRFAAAVQTILSDRDLRASLTARGKRLAERYPQDSMVDQFERLLKTCR